jgi:UDP-N-acetylglucosamine:LPS N-acetylglucosamine transferase
MRYLIVSASMGAGHDGVARELASRLSSAGHDVGVVDLIHLQPWRTGVLLRRFYTSMVRYAPWLYELIYRVFFVPHRVQPTVAPAVRLALPELRRVVARYRPDVAVSTFHLAAQALGELRLRGGGEGNSVAVIV